MIKQNMTPFIRTQKQKHLLMKVTLIMYLNTTIMSNVQKLSLGKASGWVINSVIDHNVSILKYNPLADSNYIKLPKELDHSSKGLINIQNIDDNDCFKWCLVRYLHLVDHHPERITKSDKDCARELHFKDMKVPIKIRCIHKIEKKTSIGISVFGYQNREKYPVYVAQKCCEK